MEETKRKVKVFVLSFLITVILSAFLLSLYWVSLKAQESGFEGYKNPISIEKQDDLRYIINIGTEQRCADLTLLDEAAGYFQAAERWIVPQEMRVMTRVSLFTVKQLKDNRREAREREFYKNAGLV